MMCYRVTDWQQFANVVGMKHLIRGLVYESSERYQKVNKCINERIEASDEKLDWYYWKNVLLLIGEKDLVHDIEEKYPDFQECCIDDIDMSKYLIFDQIIIKLLDTNDWKEVAHVMGVTDDEIEHFITKYPDNEFEQAYHSIIIKFDYKKVNDWSVLKQALITLKKDGLIGIIEKNALLQFEINDIVEKANLFQDEMNSIVENADLIQDEMIGIVEKADLIQDVKKIKMKDGKKYLIFDQIIIKLLETNDWKEVAHVMGVTDKDIQQFITKYPGDEFEQAFHSISIKFDYKKINEWSILKQALIFLQKDELIGIIEEDAFLQNEMNDIVEKTDFIDIVEKTDLNGIVENTDLNGIVEKSGLIQDVNKNKTKKESSSNQLHFVFDIMCCRINDWQQFANVVGVKHLIRDLVYESSERYQKISKCINERIEASDEKLEWHYWKNVLLRIDQRDLVDDIEDEYPHLLQDGRFKLVHKAIDCFGIIAHDANRRKLFKKLSVKPKDNIEICVGSGTIKMYVNTMQDLSEIQDSYFKKYVVLENTKKYDFSNGKSEECKVLQTMHNWLQNHNDSGFTIKGYDVQRHVQRYCEVYENETQYKDSYIFTYSEKNNVIFYVDTDPEDANEVIRDNSLNIRHLRTCNPCLEGEPFVYIPVTLVEPNKLELAKKNCKTCIDLQLVVSSETFKDAELFEKWWRKMSTEVKEITNEQKSKKPNKSTDLLKSIICFMAVAPFNLPNFTNSPEEGIKEAEKLIMMTLEQQQIIYSKTKRKIIKGSFGSGKTIAAQQLIKAIESGLNCSELLYYICHDSASAYIHEMKKLAATIKNDNIIVCTMSDFIGDSKSLSTLFQHLLQVNNGNAIHIFIEEFNGEVLDEDEVVKIKILLQKEVFKNSDIVIVCQSMESKRYQKRRKKLIHS